ncbi:MAG: purine-nucleoside phosphorylase [Vallitaleaceae bacterium]|nr:purine-nucleoside phosphorylase [Vallitaleaceae bacterium]
MSIPTPHIQIENKEDIAKTVLMPGDPLRAKFIAENFLENAVQVNSVRNMFAYTGTYKGEKVTVFGSGMGMASIGIYSYELFAFYDVEKIIRIGSCGAYSPDLKVYDVLLVDEAWSESSFAKVQSGFEGDTIAASTKLNQWIEEKASNIGIPIKVAKIHSSDVFYHEDGFDYKYVRDVHGCKAVEMESFALFANARTLNKEAACLLTVSDSFESGEVTTSEERQNAFTKMMEIALETVVK